MLYANDRMRQDADSTNARMGDGTVRLTVPEAAEAMGISAEAVRARIKRKTLTIERDATGAVFVVLDADLMRQVADGMDDGTGIHALLEAKDETITALRAQLARAEERDRENRRLLAAALERIPAIEPPQDTPPERPGAPETPAEPQSGTQTPPDTERRSWWQRWFGIQ